MLAADGLSLVFAPGSAPWPAGVQLQIEALAPYPLNQGATDLAPLLQALLPGPQLGINLAKGASLRLEILLEPDGADALLAPRLAMELAEGAQLELWLRICCRESALCLPLVTAQLAQNARFQEGQGLEGCSAAVLLASSQVQQAPDSHYERTALVQGWGLARQDPQVLQSAGQAHTQLRDLALATGQAISDLHSRVRFEGPDGRLDQLQKALVDDQAHSVFNGSVQVPRLAQGTDAAQLSRHLLLSSRARVDTKPELEIVADDVRCSHGATVSSLADDELFYLQSRGIDRDRASSLLMRGFCAQIVASLPPLAAAWQPLERLLANAHG
jgi:FeS assembly protein SufD